MRRWIIDDFGDIVEGTTAALHRVLGLPKPDNDGDIALLEDRAIRLIGIVVIEETTDELHVRCRPSHLSDRAAATLSHWLFEHRLRPVSIRWYDETWRNQTVPNGRVAIDVVTALLDLRARKGRPSRDRILILPSTQAARSWQKIKPHVAAITAQSVNREKLEAVLDPILLGRWTLVDIDIERKKIDVVAVGRGYPGAPSGGGTTDFSQLLEVVDDADYRDWVLAGYFEVAKTQKPQFDDVDAYINWRLYGDLRSRYWRMLVPLWARHGIVRLLSASGSDSGIDLRS